eukprot:TRINITY_DN5355_c0_g1_i1.p1 TRINITY_DN5355_c0_g1~~TRINITY_DN5355_c0_g1_i1.p1  ORF type:complete len:533 (+),score=121.26 TRINITY_DN5355_c0_g1_i1:213-1601(+)
MPYMGRLKEAEANLRQKQQNDLALSSSLRDVQSQLSETKTKYEAVKRSAEKMMGEQERKVIELESDYKKKIAGLELEHKKQIFELEKALDINYSFTPKPMNSTSASTPTSTTPTSTTTTSTLTASTSTPISLAERGLQSPAIMNMIESSTDSIRSETAGLLDFDRSRWSPMGNFSTIRISDDQIQPNTLKRSRDYYRSQTNLLTSPFDGVSSAQNADEEKRVKIAVYGSVAVNVLLCGAKLYAAITSNSLAIVASTLDSFLELLSALILFITTWLMKRANRSTYRKYHQNTAGKTRLAPLGVIIFAACIFTAAIQLLVSGVSTLLEGHSSVNLTISSIVIIGLSVGLNIILFIYCKLQKSAPTVQAIAKDHINDAITNTIGLICVLIAYNQPNMQWWIDAIAGMLMGIYIMFTWFTNGYDQVPGRFAPSTFISKVTLACWNHHPSILSIDNASAFHLALGFF